MSFGHAITAAAATVAAAAATPDAPEVMNPASSAINATRCSSQTSGTNYDKSGQSLLSLLCTEEGLNGVMRPDGALGPNGCCGEAALIGTTSSLPPQAYNSVTTFKTTKMDWGSQPSTPRPAGQPCTPTPENTAAAETQAETRHAASCRPSPPGCLHYHQNIPPEHRVLIVGWMRQVCEALGLHASTLFMATSLLDRFMAASQVPTPEGILQLVALASMSVAVKFNEVLQVKPSIWLGLAVNSTGVHLYQPCDLQRCEFTLLQTIDWQLHEPNTFTFLEHLLVSHRTPLSGQTQVVDSSCSDGSCGASRRAHSSPGLRSTRLASAVPEWHESSNDNTPNTSGFCESAVATVAASLAELSLMYDTFLSHEYCTVAQACVMLAQRLLAHEGKALHGVVKPPLGPWEPGLAACIEALELCCSPGERHFAMAAEAGRNQLC
ncbi:hypothetical protein Vafri_5064 [Volvox africanus]|uniref:Cyclin-like domain-containing protein n=1 Tax=Volvox africanus TaxID=51714 RepID=A0A8J4EY30_9CHLO|nr:hypothetical protein Vafri_5064 [Volvox africanus]